MSKSWDFCLLSAPDNSVERLPCLSQGQVMQKIWIQIQIQTRQIQIQIQIPCRAEHWTCGRKYRYGWAGVVLTVWTISMLEWMKISLRQCYRSLSEVLMGLVKYRRPVKEHKRQINLSLAWDFFFNLSFFRQWCDWEHEVDSHKVVFTILLGDGTSQKYSFVSLVTAKHIASCTRKSLYEDAILQNRDNPQRYISPIGWCYCTKNLGMGTTFFWLGQSFGSPMALTVMWWEKFQNWHLYRYSK